MSIVLTRATKQAARYTDAGGRERCSGCRFFLPQGTCGRIIGPVSPRGWCKYYSMEAVQRWQPQGAVGFGTGPSLALDFMNAGTMPTGITFTRASTATYVDASGIVQSAAINTPRWDYTGGVFRGLLIEEQRSNIIGQSGDVSNAAWSKSNFNGPGPPVATANQAVAPDGTMSAASVAYPAISGAGAGSIIAQIFGGTANVFAISAWLRGSVGGEQVYLVATDGGAVYYRTLCTLTTSWQRFSLVTSALTAASWYVTIGADLRDASQSAKPAQTIYEWGIQVERGTFTTSYIPTAAVGVTRSFDRCFIPSANMGFFASPGGSWAAEFIVLDTASATSAGRILGTHNTTTAPVPMYVDTTGHIGQWDGTVAITAANVTAVGAVAKAATTYVSGTGRVCLNAGAIASAALTGGYSSLAASGIGFINDSLGAGEWVQAGYIRRVRYWPRVLSDTEMQSITT